ncbi:FAD-binding oxidoreductase [Martelella soudanensis]|nr:FAD-linked oxidase C-terminal domain-containing protein [Martelella sp. NC18]
MEPDAVAFADTANEVSRITEACHRHNVPIIAFGAGTSVEDQVAAAQGGVCIDLSRMNNLVEIRPQDMLAVVEPGVTRKALNQALRDTGLFFPIDPGADASIGGMAATRASGTNAVRYGTMRDNVLALEVVLANGTIIRTGSRAQKSAAGYDLTGLFVGSEGTLGVITELTVKLYGIPEAVSVAVCPFPSLVQAVDAAIGIKQLGLSVARMELMDTVQMQASNAYSHLSHPLQPCLFFEFHGSPAHIAEQSEIAGSVCKDCGGTEFTAAEQAEERNRLWTARHDAYFAATALRPGAHAWPTDVCVPISQLARCIQETAEDLEKEGILAPICGHVGDGNFHALLLLDPEDADEMARAETVSARLVERAIAMGGTCTGEHGVGLGKMKYMPLEHGPALSAMAALKTALDPKGLLNPGKIIPHDYVVSIL